MKNLSSSLIIPTYNRPDALAKCIRSILNQTVKPDEILVIDDGELDDIPLRNQCEARGIKCRLERKPKKGVVHSRNLGIELAQNDMVFLLEDDVELFPDYMEQILKVFRESDDLHLGGVGGIIVNLGGRNSIFKRLLKLTYMIFLVCSRRPGKILPSGFSEDLDNPADLSKVDYLMGGVSAFRKDVIKQYRFSERFQGASGYGQGEDKDFSLRISQDHQLLINPAAKLYHYPAKKNSFDKSVKGRAYILSRFFLFDQFFNKHWLSWMFFAYATFGYILIRSVLGLSRFDIHELQRIKGVFSGLKDIALHRHELKHL